MTNKANDILGLSVIVGALAFGALFVFSIGCADYSGLSSQGGVISFKDDANVVSSDYHPRVNGLIGTKEKYTITVSIGNKVITFDVSSHFWANNKDKEVVKVRVVGFGSSTAYTLGGNTIEINKGNNE